MTIQEQMREKLLQAGIPAKDVKCYGSQIMITTWALPAAQKWYSLLRNFCHRVQFAESVDYNQENQNTVLRPSTHRVWRIWGTV